MIHICAPRAPIRCHALTTLRASRRRMAQHDISNKERKFVDETCRPEKINIEGPCVHFIRETLEVLKSYRIGTQPGNRPLYAECRSSKRRKINRETN